MSGNINSNFGYSSVNGANIRQQKQEQKNNDVQEKEETLVQTQNETTQNAPEEVLDFMSALSTYGQAGITKTSVKNIDPTKYLSSDRIANIEKLMQEFDKKYDESYDAIKAEFGDKLSENAMRSLALYSLS